MADETAASGSFRLVVGYDGTSFHGWQTQPGLRTVQGVLEETLSSVLGQTVRVEGAGRTDAGVHARGQVASFDSQSTLPARALPPRLNALLPGDVRVTAATPVTRGFSARRSARARHYGYRLLHRRDVLLERFAWYPERRFDPDRLSRATRALEGERDFSALRGAGSTPTTPVCRVISTRWSVDGAGIRFDFIADHFLYHMVRNAVGTAIAAAGSSDPRGYMEEVIASGDRRRGGITAPPHGLCLEQVFYPAEPHA